MPPQSSASPTEPMPHTVAADGVRIWFEDEGTGPAIVFAHEFGGEPASWDAQVAALTEDHRCIRPAARGFRPSDVPDNAEQYGQRQATDDLLALFHCLGLNDAHLVGTSMGSFTSLDFAMRHPNRVRTLTLVGHSSGPRDPQEQDRYRTGWVGEEIRWRNELGSDGAVEILERDPAYQRLRREHPAEWAAYANRLKGQPVSGALHILKTLHWNRRSLWSETAEIQAITCPVLLVHGDEDYFLVAETNHFLEDTIPTVQRVVQPSTGHLVNIERPNEFNELLRTHITGASDAPHATRSADGKR